MSVHVETGTPLHPNHYETKTLDHLGLVSAMIDELGLVEQIDALLPKDEEKQTISHGQAVKAMILNGLGFAHRALYLTPLFFRDKPVDRLIGEGVTADQINDDALGRALDAVYNYGIDSLYGQLAVKSVHTLGLTGGIYHMDSSSFHTDGRYNSECPPQEGSDIIHVTKGYSRDHRPDLNQVVLQLICENKSGIPVLMQPLSGNSNDKINFRDTVTKHIAQLKKDVGLEYLVADSAFYTRETLELSQDLFWISRVPETLSLALYFIESHAPSLMVDFNQMSMIDLPCQYGDIDQRWLLVYSPEARQRSLKTCKKQFQKVSDKEMRNINALFRQEFACQADAEQSVEKLQKQLKLTELTDIEYKEVARYSKKGRPAKNAKPDKIVIQVSAILSSDSSLFQKKIQQKSCFIIATNQLDSNELPNSKLLKIYKEQQKVERGFRFLKDPLFMATTFFVKSEERLMAITMIMTLCLMIYAALEHRIRQALSQFDEFFPDQVGGLTNKPTARWVFLYFKGIHVLVIRKCEEMILNLNEHQKKLLLLLGKRYIDVYS
ncbi:IS1634 family transposase [Ectothiorhodospiraceae bacterium BW-2]|nr:IS1634 family transposase [Ectothiorhodospiraceae bacterium BW-2]QEP43607.1 IS1634 family transposase [Ectothiorhodospiraceae bacterium BW-2]QEP44774.1 IS1634 family transposase [Ectothiorhodospiraceae bacterium BW-2]